MSVRNGTTIRIVIPPRFNGGICRKQTEDHRRIDIVEDRSCAFLERGSCKMMVEGSYFDQVIRHHFLASQSAKFNSGGGLTRSRNRTVAPPCSNCDSIPLLCPILVPPSCPFVSFSLEREKERKQGVFVPSWRFPFGERVHSNATGENSAVNPVGKFPGAMSARCNNRS